MVRRAPREARFVGLWSAAWLGGFLLFGVLRVGDLSRQWPVLAVPVLWALVALRPRRRSDPPPAPPVRAYRSDTVERPAVRPPHPRRYRDG